MAAGDIVKVIGPVIEETIHLSAFSARVGGLHANVIRFASTDIDEGLNLIAATDSASDGSVITALKPCRAILGFGGRGVSGPAVNTIAIFDSSNTNIFYRRADSSDASYTSGSGLIVNLNIGDYIVIISNQNLQADSTSVYLTIKATANPEANV